MEVSYLLISASCTVLSFVTLQYWMGMSLDKLRLDGLIGEDLFSSDNLTPIMELLLGSYTATLLVANFVLSFLALLILCLKTIFFSQLYSSEMRKLVERLVHYFIYKGTFIPLVVPQTAFQAGLWSTWLAVLCFLKMFQALARDRLERLNASPSVTPLTYFRVYSALLMVLTVDLLWMKLCLTLYSMIDSSILLLLFFEPLSIAFETLQAIVVHGFQLVDVWSHDSVGDGTNGRTSKILDLSAGSLWEWKGSLIRNMGFFLDMMTLLMALAHYVHIWWLHGMAFHLVDAVLFLNIRALLSAMVNRVKGFIRLNIALATLHGALPDATAEEMQAYDDECAICREPMAKAKKLSCNHLFHLACLRSWLDQGSSENYSCPTCRKPLFAGHSENEVNASAPELSSDEQLARQISAGLNRPNRMRNPPAGVHTNQPQNSTEHGDWRRGGMDPSWLGLDGAGPSTGVGSAGLSRVQMMMRHLAAVGETYAQTALEDASWSLWPMNPSQPGSSSQPGQPVGSARYPGSTSGLHLRTTPPGANDNVANMLAMAEVVREVLPHIPDEVIFQDLQRTNSATVTVNNLLQM